MNDVKGTTMTTDPRDAEVLHRLLDEAFAPYPVTPESLDLKQEMRANLAARAAELRDAGTAPDAAARQALAEVGDIGALLDEESASTATTWVSEQRRHRVRPKPAFVVRTVLIAAALVAVLAVLVLGALGLPAAGSLALAAIPIAGLLVGWLVADGLRQETTTNYPFSRPVAIGFGIAAGLLVVALGAASRLLAGFEAGWLVVAAIALVASIALFTYLGVTRTNRHKPWVLRMTQAQPPIADRFEKDPAAAARFGIYTMLLWVSAIAAFLVLSFTIGWAWSWIALLLGWVVWFLVLTRMLFAPSTTK